MIGGGTGPATGTCATTCTPGPWNIHAMLQAAEAFPINLGFLGKGNASLPAALDEQIEAGACGLKLHEDWGTTPAAIDTCLAVADGTTSRSPSTPTRSTSPASSRTRSRRSRAARSTPTTPRAPAAATRPTSSSSPACPTCCRRRPTRRCPYTVNTIDEHLDMLMVCHHLDPAIAEDVAFAESRIRRETIAAEDVLHDLGAFSMMSSDSQAMGRVGEVIVRTWQTAAQDEGAARRLPGDRRRATTTSASSATSPSTRSTRRSRTASPHEVGSIEPGKLADLVLWKPAFFGVKPSLVLKGGMIAAAAMGDPNASIPTPQPVHYRPMFGALRRARCATSCVTFVSQAALDAGIGRQARPAQAAQRGARHAHDRQARHGPQRRHADDRGRRADLRGARRRRAADLRAGARCCRWRSATSCSEARAATPSARCVIVSKLIAAGRGLAAALVRRASDGRARLGHAPEEPLRGARLARAGALAVFLPRGRIVRGGDVLVAEDGSLIARRGAGAADPRRHGRGATRRACSTLATAAYHLGNRHVPLEVRADRLVLEPDHVLAEMLARMGLEVATTSGAVRAGAGRLRRCGRSRMRTAHDARPRARRTSTTHEHDHGHAPRPRPRSLVRSRARAFARCARGSRRIAAETES